MSTGRQACLTKVARRIQSSTSSSSSIASGPGERYPRAPAASVGTRTIGIQTLPLGVDELRGSRRRITAAQHRESTGGAQ